MYLIKKDGNILKQVTFDGDKGLYRDKIVSVISFMEYKKAKEVCDSIKGCEIQEVDEEEYKKILGE